LYKPIGAEGDFLPPQWAFFMGKVNQQEMDGPRVKETLTKHIDGMDSRKTASCGPGIIPDA